MKLDLHVHSRYSKDSLISLKSLKKKSLRTGICPIITDHNTIKGNIAYNCPILAEEISTLDGHVIGYFLTEHIRPKLTAIETIELIHEQGGLACIPHIFDNVRKNSLNDKEIAKKSDIIEIFNARVQRHSHNNLALDFAISNRKLKSVGSDAHWLPEFGKNYIEIEDFNSVKEFKKNLKKANFFTQRNSILYLIGTKFYNDTIRRII
ncbi:PHP domain-containing protein [Candidatus Woesearchaeota archaeon]|nr:MAG: PHP domain-containing protein [Candidatus Woesearchaeota archaeon]